jgi:hypothetical protein
MKTISKQLLFAAVLGTSAFSHAATYTTSIKSPECLSSVGGLFTVGGQYVTASGQLDPLNGVLNDSYSMLVRWQGNNFVNNPVGWNVSNFTGLGLPQFVDPIDQRNSNLIYQRGVLPEDTTGSPAVQLYCSSGGMLINTWAIPHRHVEGGGYNNMFGYQWGANEPPAFLRYTNGYGVISESSLIVQANIAVPQVYTYSASVNASARLNYPAPQQQVSLYAYIKDNTRPDLPPIALVAFTHDKGTANSVGAVLCDYAQGVWFASGNTSLTSNYFTNDELGTVSTAAEVLPPSKFNPSEPLKPYRMKVTRQNLTNLTAAINAKVLPPGTSCPARGYSTNPDNYTVKYAGVIAELTIFDERFGSYMGSPTAPDFSKDQGSMSVKFSDLAILRGWDY